MEATATPPPLYSSSSAAGAGNDKAALSSDFETFLRMLTVQVQNQDPLNPVDSTDYATQLATFSSVEQQVLTNDLLRGMSDVIGGNALQQMGAWLGTEVLVRAPVVFDGTPVTIRPDYAQDTDSAVLLVRNSEDAVVDRVPIDMTQTSLEWTGLDEEGVHFPAGTYSFDIESYAGDELIDVYSALTYLRIDEVRADGGTMLLRLPDGSEIPSSLGSGPIE